MPVSKGCAADTPAPAAGCNPRAHADPANSTPPAPAGEEGRELACGLPPLLLPLLGLLLLAAGAAGGRLEAGGAAPKPCCAPLKLKGARPPSGGLEDTWLAAVVCSAAAAPAVPAWGRGRVKGRQVVEICAVRRVMQVGQQNTQLAGGQPGNSGTEVRVLPLDIIAMAGRGSKQPAMPWECHAAPAKLGWLAP